MFLRQLYIMGAWVIFSIIDANPEGYVTGRPGVSAHRPMGPAARAKRGSL